MSIVEQSTAEGGTRIDGELVAAQPGAPAGRRRFLRRFAGQRAAVVALGFLLLVGLVALLAPVLAPYEPDRGVLADALQGPSGEHWLGTDDLGRDILSRLLHAGRISLSAAFIAVGIAAALGFPPGLIAGYVGGRWDTAIMRVNDTLMSFPPLILAVTIVGVLGPDLVNAMVAIGIVYAPRFMRVIRAATLTIREEAFVEAATMMGSSPARTIRRHVLPNALSPIVVEITLSLGFAILAEASLSFIGLGVQPPSASWGSMLKSAFRYLADAPVFALMPGVAIFLVVLSLNMLGDGLRDSLGREARSRR